MRNLRDFLEKAFHFAWGGATALAWIDDDRSWKWIIGMACILFARAFVVPRVQGFVETWRVETWRKEMAKAKRQ